MIKFLLPVFISCSLFAIDISQTLPIQPTNTQVVQEQKNVQQTKQDLSTKEKTNKLVDQKTQVYGSHLFSGNFSKMAQHIFNPNYLIAIGDNINLKMWGAYEYEAVLSVDSQGNIFIPKVGAIKVAGISNAKLSSLISSKVKEVYSSNVFVYSDLGTYQPISVFVTGNVYNPGIYQGLSSDSVLQYLDRAGGINNEYGSYRKISILRNNNIIRNVDLYSFLLNGQIEQMNFVNGDVVLVDSVGSYVSVTGEVQRPYRFEAKEDKSFILSDLARLSGIKPTATNAIVKSYNQNNQIKVLSFASSDFNKVILKPGDSVQFLPDHTGNDVNVLVEGEHNGLHNLVLPKGSTLASLKQALQLNDLSDLKSIQVFRKSVAQMQKKLIEAQLKELETLALTTTSSSPQEASTRSLETKAILEFIERAKEIEPKGQVVINEKTSDNDIVLEDGDTIFIPNKTNVIIVQGEVTLPGAFTYVQGQSLTDYLALAGDLNERANKERILVIRSSGRAEKADLSSFSFSAPEVKAGDSVLVLPKAESKSLQVTSMMTQILYHIAVATKVVLDL